MKNFNEIVQLAKNLVTLEEGYQVSPTKAQSARMRNTINDMKKLATPAKKDLMEADKG